MQTSTPPRRGIFDGDGGIYGNKENGMNKIIL